MSPVVVTGLAANTIPPGFLFSLHPVGIVLISGTDITLDIDPASLFLPGAVVRNSIPAASERPQKTQTAPTGVAGL
jgi:hypothetical protein